MWVPHGAGTTRSMGVSYRALKLIGGTAAVLLVVGLGFAYTAIRKGVDISRLERLERANQLLAEQVVQTRTRLHQVNDTVAAIMKRDELVRLLAGLPLNDPDVQRAGIGGPAGVPSEREQVLAEQPLGREALQMQEDVEGLIRRGGVDPPSQPAGAVLHRGHRQPGSTWGAAGPHALYHADARVADQHVRAGPDAPDLPRGAPS